MNGLIFPIFLSLSGLIAGCTTKAPVQTESPPPVRSEPRPNHIAVVPGTNTKVITYHVQLENFPAALKSEAEESLSGLAAKCWIYSDTPEAMQTPTEPQACFKFAKFKHVDQLKPYKKEPTEKKMLLTALEREKIHVQNFVWDGAKLQRVHNSDSQIPAKAGTDRLADFVVGWAHK